MLFRTLLAAVWSQLSVATMWAAPTLVPAKDGIEVKAGAVLVSGQVVNVRDTPLAVAAAPVIHIVNEALKLTTAAPNGYASGTPLKGCDAHNISARHAFVPGSLTLVRAADGVVLREGDDYLLDAEWGHLGLAPKSRVTAEETVLASYDVSHLRLDTVQVAPDGTVSVKAGQPHLATPRPPEPDAGCLALAHVFVDYRSTAIDAAHIYPITESAAQAKTATTGPARIPRTLAKLRAGEPVTIVCFGDSVTAGSSASDAAHTYVSLFTAGLRARFPQSAITVQNTSAGGSNSQQWLYPERFPFHGQRGAASVTQFQHVLDAKPDLVTIEFVNDQEYSRAQVDEIYDEMRRRLQPTGAEIILITPHFTMWPMMGFTSMRDRDSRPYVLALRDFATRHQLGLADASARWEHLAAEGLPYLTLLANTVNHPDDRGHQIFADELLKAFP